MTAAPKESTMYSYSSDDHSGTSTTISGIAQAHGLRARTLDQLCAAVERVGGYITVCRAGQVVAQVAQ